MAIDPIQRIRVFYRTMERVGIVTPLSVVPFGPAFLQFFQFSRFEYFNNYLKDEFGGFQSNGLGVADELMMRFFQDRPQTGSDGLNSPLQGVSP